MQNRRSERIVLTGGPGAGKTAALEVIRRQFCERVEVLPEAASILFKGGFPRRSTYEAQCGAQRAIFHIQRELETIALEGGKPHVILCDRGTLDSLAYWPGSEAQFFQDLGTTLEEELARYRLVVHLTTPSANEGYNHHNPLRIETALEAKAIDHRISEVWRRHPRLVTIPPHARFFDKVRAVVDVIRNELPEDCLEPEVPLLRGAGSSG